MARAVCVYPSELDQRRLKVLATLAGMSMSAFLIDCVRTQYNSLWRGAGIDDVERLVARHGDTSSVITRSDGIRVKRRAP